jgi:hypothetical protein
MVNERVDNQGNPSKQILGINGDKIKTNELNLSRRGNKTLLELLVIDVKVTTKKEKWGRGDVYYKSAQFGLPGQVCDEHKLNGALINMFATRDMSTFKGIQGNRVLPIFFPFTNNDDAWKSYKTCYVVLYEHDNRKKWSKTMSPPYCSNITMPFNSKQDIYGACVPSRNDFLGVPQQSGVSKIFTFSQAELVLGSDWMPEN